MDTQYDVYCMADRTFFDAPTTIHREELQFAVAGRPLPEGWRRVELDDWLVFRPPDVELPAQGWKIHVSACLDNADAVLEAVWDYCVPRRITFKFLCGRHMLLSANAKYADRGSSGKFVTIYPSGEEHFGQILNELGAMLQGQPGPYILSDLRWSDGPLYVRYGGYTERRDLFERGVLEPAIVDDSGLLVPDRREPRFTVPAWITLPRFLEPHLAARTAARVDELPYQITKALHFSNGGGLYLALDTRTDEQVVLKEARPYAGLSADGHDAVVRQERERLVLTALAGIDAVPALRDTFVLDGHHFLVQDYVEGTALRSLMVQRYPLSAEQPTEPAIAEYTEWALRMSARIEAAVDQVHKRGVVINDLHLYNVLVRPDDRIALIDFEVADLPGEESKVGLGNPAFAPPDDRTGAERDRYAVACIRLFLFLPLTALLQLQPRKVAELAGAIRAHFPVPEEYLEQALEVLAPRDQAAVVDLPRPAADPATWRAAAASLARGIAASATPRREDRLFPGDVEQFILRTPGLAYGAAGVLYALHQAGCAVDPNHIDWLARRSLHPPQGGAIGFYDGLHGAAYVLELLDRRREALDVLDICLRERWTELPLDLSGGLAGIGLNLAHLSARTGEPALAEAAQRAVDVVADRLGDEDSIPGISGAGHRYAGLLRGSSGPALLFLRRYQQTGEPALLDLASTALRQDLRRTTLLSDGVRHVDEGWRTMPYLLDGSVGIGMVIDDFLSHRDDDELRSAAAQIHRAACGTFYIEPGLFSGRAGMIVYLARQYATGAVTHRDRQRLVDQIGRLSWHALDYQGHLAFPGESLLRLSMDLATGSAGVLLALAAALDPARGCLPFLEPQATLSPGPSPGTQPDRQFAHIER